MAQDEMSPQLQEALASAAELAGSVSRLSIVMQQQMPAIKDRIAQLEEVERPVPAETSSVLPPVSSGEQSCNDESVFKRLVPASIGAAATAGMASLALIIAMPGSKNLKNAQPTTSGNTPSFHAQVAPGASPARRRSHDDHPRSLRIMKHLTDHRLTPPASRHVVLAAESTHSVPVSHPLATHNVLPAKSQTPQVHVATKVAKKVEPSKASSGGAAVSTAPVTVANSGGASLQRPANSGGAGIK